MFLLQFRLLTIESRVKIWPVNYIQALSMAAASLGFKVVIMVFVLASFAWWGFLFGSSPEVIKKIHAQLNWAWNFNCS